MSQVIRNLRHHFVTQIDILVKDDVDLREKELNKVLRSSTTRALVELFKGDAGSIAAWLSVCTTVVDAQVIEKMSLCMTDVSLLDYLSSLALMPLATSHEKATKFYQELLGSKGGRALYRDIALLLAWGSKQEDLRGKIGKQVRAKPTGERTTIGEAPADEMIVALAKQDGTRAALVRLRDARSSNGITLSRAAATLEQVLGDIPQDEALELFRAEIPVDERIALIAARGDLESVTAYVADRYELLAALFQDLLDPKKVTEDYAMYLLSWVQKMASHRDFERMLTLRLGQYTFREMIALAVFDRFKTEGANLTRDARKMVGEITADRFTENSLDPDWASDFLLNKIKTIEVGGRSVHQIPRLKREVIEGAALAARRLVDRHAPEVEGDNDQAVHSTEAIEI